MPFQFGNQEWRKRKANRGGRPTREQTKKKRIEERELNRAIEKYADIEGARILMRIFKIRPETPSFPLKGEKRS